MKKLARGILCGVSAAVMTLAAAIPSYAENDLKWEFESPKEISGYLGEEKNLIFPEYGTVPVTNMMSGAFKNHPLESIRLPSKLERIGISSFENCGLTSVTFGENVETLFESAFEGNRLTRVDLPKSVSCIKGNAFADNPNLTINFVGRTEEEVQASVEFGNNWSGTAKVVYNQPPEETPPMDSGDTANIEVTGTIEPVTSLNLDVPVQTAFLINADRDFIASEFEIVNRSAAPVTVTAVSLKAKSGTSAKVTAEDAYTDEQWNNLSAADTQSKIALGLRVQESSSLTSALFAESLWFGDESGDSNLELGSIQSAYGQEQPPKLVLQYDAKYGKQWGDVSSLSYELVLCFETE